MSRDPGDIPRAWGEIDVVTALSVARGMPVEALELAAERPARIAHAVLDVVRRAGAGDELSERERNLLFWGVFVLGHARDLRLFGPLMVLLKRPDEELGLLFGDDILMEGVPRLSISVFDGDPAPLLALLRDPTADESVRMSQFGALTYLTWAGRIPASVTRAFLIEFDEERPIRAGDAGWHGWEAAIALLGYEDLVPRAEAAHADARLLGDMAGPEWCREQAAQAAAAPEDRARFERDALGEIGHPVDEFDYFLSGPDEETEPAGDEPVRNPLRDVGRNDPCPCGSGRKFKKCCLAAA